MVTVGVAWVSTTAFSNIVLPPYKTVSIVLLFSPSGYKAHADVWVEGVESKEKHVVVDRVHLDSEVRILDACCLAFRDRRWALSKMFEWYAPVTQVEFVLKNTGSERLRIAAIGRAYGSP